MSGQGRTVKPSRRKSSSKVKQGTGSGYQQITPRGPEMN